MVNNQAADGGRNRKADNMAKRKTRFWLPDRSIDLGMINALNLTDTRVLLVYACDASDNLAAINTETVATIAGVNSRSVQRSIRTLVKEQTMKRVSANTGGRGVFTEYRLFPDPNLDYGSGGQFWIPVWFVNSDLFRTLGLAEIRVVLAYTRLANSDGEIYWSIDKIASMVNLSPRSVQRAIRRVCSLGLMQRVSRGLGGYKRPTTYRLIFRAWLDYQSGPIVDQTGKSYGPDPWGKGDTAVGVSDPEFSTKGDTDAGVSNRKGRQTRSKTTTNGVLNHDRAMSPEGSKKEFLRKAPSIDNKDAGRPRGRLPYQNDHDGNDNKVSGAAGVLVAALRMVNSGAASGGPALSERQTRKRANQQVRALDAHLAATAQDTTRQKQTATT